MNFTESDLVLRQFRPDDREPMQLLANDPEVAKYLADRFRHPYTLEDADAWIGLTEAETRPCNFAVVWQGRFVGDIGLVPLADIHSCTAEIGYWLGQPFWGMGLMTRAVRLLLPYAFEELLFVRLQAEVFSENFPSMHVLEKNGFVREGTMRKHIRKNGRIHDAVLYARLRNE
ncbi:MAG: GNAT family N-acetyltransferase [Planctomycetes bacterium]|nr:GNAT family N-acetyltransferase [Planctomycetota bacterium]